MSEDTLQLILQRLDQVEREQTRLRTDLLNQMERVLTEMHGFRDDMTVTMGYAMRADAVGEASGTIQRGMQGQITNLRTRIERLEGRQSGPS